MVLHQIYNQLIDHWPVQHTPACGWPCAHSSTLTRAFWVDQLMSDPFRAVLTGSAQDLTSYVRSS